MERVYTKTFGVEKGYNKGQEKYFVICDGRKTGLNYSKYDFAIKKSESFVKSVYKPFKDFQGYDVSFEYIKI